MERGLGRFVAPLYCRPAARWGIGACDCITHRDGEAVLGLTLSEAVEKMRGRTGTDITLTVRREGRDPFDVTVTRDVVRIQSVRSRVEGNAGYVRITTFNEQTMEGLGKAISELKGELGEKMIEIGRASCRERVCQYG